MNFHYPAFGICGYSNAGKTTVILELVRQLSARGLTIGVIKHDTHGIQIDREGKDSDRIFNAGADVLIGDPTQFCLRLHRRGEMPLHEALKRMAPSYDLILVEGHKTTPLPNKVWLSGGTDDTPPPEATGITRILRRAEDRSRILLEMIEDWLPTAWQAVPVYAGILIGGKSTRMGRPKHLLETGGRTWLEHAAAAVHGCTARTVLLGTGDVPASLADLPRLSDVEDAQGPLRGMLAAMRWAPFASWLFLPCDTPLVSAEAMLWLMSHRRPGVRAVLPHLPSGRLPEPLPAYYDFRAAPLLESSHAPASIASCKGVESPTIPPPHSTSWQNLNTPEDAKTLD